MIVDCCHPSTEQELHYRITLRSFEERVGRIQIGYRLKLGHPFKFFVLGCKELVDKLASPWPSNLLLATEH